MEADWYALPEFSEVEKEREGKKLKNSKTETTVITASIQLSLVLCLLLD